MQLPGFTRPERDYSSNEICTAAGLRRTTLDAWVLRGYFELPEGPGTGRERRFSRDEFIAIMIATELNRLGLNVAVAAHAANYLRRLAKEGKKVPIDDERCLLFIRQPPASKPLEVSAPTLTGLVVTWPETSERLKEIMDKELSDSPAMAIVDISGIVKRAMDRIGVSQSRSRGGR